MKKIGSKTVINAMTFALFILMLADAYFDHKDEIDESVARLRATLSKEKEEGAQTDAE